MIDEINKEICNNLKYDILWSLIEFGHTKKVWRKTPLKKNVNDVLILYPNKAMLTPIIADLLTTPRTPTPTNSTALDFCKWMCNSWKIHVDNSRALSTFYKFVTCLNLSIQARKGLQCNKSLWFLFSIVFSLFNLFLLFVLSLVVFVMFFPTIMYSNTHQMVSFYWCTLIPVN